MYSNEALIRAARPILSRYLYHELPILSYGQVNLSLPNDLKVERAALLLFSCSLSPWMGLNFEYVCIKLSSEILSLKARDLIPVHTISFNVETLVLFSILIVYIPEMRGAIESLDSTYFYF